MLLPLIGFALVMLAMSRQQNATVDNGTPPSDNTSDGGGSVDLFKVAGSAVAVAGSIAGIAGGSSATVATASAATTATTSGASSASIKATQAATAAGLGVSTGFLIYLGVVTVVVIVATIADAVMLGNRKYWARFTALANIQRIFAEMDKQELLLLEWLAKRMGVAYTVSEKRDYDLDWQWYGEGKEQFVTQGFHPTFTVQSPLTKSMQLDNAQEAVANLSTFNEAAATICVANRESWIAYATMAMQMAVGVRANFSAPVYTDKWVDKNGIEYSSMEHWFYERPFVMAGNVVRPNVPSAVYDSARGAARLRAVVEAFKLAKFCPTLFLEGDLPQFPPFFLNSVGFPDGDSYYFARNGTKYIAKKEAFGVDNDVEIDLISLREGLPGFKVIS